VLYSSLFFFLGLVFFPQFIGFVLFYLTSLLRTP
jgi:hypothetical protein